MLAKRIDAIDPKMPRDIRRWFLEKKYAIPSAEHQDWDLVLAEWNRVPLLIEYVEDTTNVLEKRFDAFSALMVLQASESEMLQKENLNEEIVRIVLGNRDFAEKVCADWLGLTEHLIVQKILGKKIPPDTPDYIREEATKRFPPAR